MEQTTPLLLAVLKTAENILHQDDCRIHNDAEVDGAHGQQIRAFALHHQENGGEEQGEGDVQAHDDRAAEIAEKDPLNQEYQEAPENQVVQNRVGGKGDQ